LLIYGTTANVSIEKLFMAGVGPGLLIGIGLMGMSKYLGRKFLVNVEDKSTLKEKISSISRSLPALLLAIIIFGGIMGGASQYFLVNFWNVY